MARYYVSKDDDLETVARELLEAADDHRNVVYLPGEGPNGAFDLPDSLAEGYTSKAAAKARAERVEREDAIREADQVVRSTPGPDEPTTEDLREEGQRTNVVRGTYDPPAPAKRTSRRSPTKRASGNQDRATAQDAQTEE
jgi:hypothetical protein